MNAPSNANTSGLIAEIDAEMEGRQRGYADVRGELLFRCRDALVTAASAQARIAELEAEKARLGRVLMTMQEAIPTAYHPNGAGLRLFIHHLKDPATAAEARADRLAKALETLEAERKRDGVNLAHLKRAVAVAYADTARAALQQETQP